MNPFYKIRNLQIQTTRLAKDVLAGAYHSAFRGKGMEFEEVREYQNGDEVRSIDWNVTARMAHPYVKSFREERELTVMLLVDMSASVRFGSDKSLKSQMIAEIGSVMAFSAIKNNDKVGMILFTNTVEKYIPPKKGTRHVLRLIRELLAFQPKGVGTDLANALSFLGRVHRKSSICFLISDFFCSGYDHEMAINAKNHDLISISVTDPLEIDLPDMNLTNFTDLETGETHCVDTSKEETREQFRRRAQHYSEHHQQLSERVGAGYIAIRTDQHYIEILRKFFKIRALRRK